MTADASVSSDASCPAPGEEQNFTAACKASGGTETDGICVCSKTICDVGIVCNFETKQCANAGEAGGECTEETPSVCTNSPAGIGIVKECQNGHKVNYSCQTVSCNEAGDACGECNNISDEQSCFNSPNLIGQLTKCSNGRKVKESCGANSCNEYECGKCKNYTLVCENDEETGVGEVRECQSGQSGKTFTKCPNVSCKGDTPACGECLNGELKCTEDSNNNAIMWRCIDGKWARLQQTGSHRSGLQLPGGMPYQRKPEK